MATLKGANARPHLAFSIIALSAGLLAGGCAQTGTSPETTAALTPEKSAEGTRPQSELEKATEYWGKAHGKDRKNKAAALNYARNLRALGQQQLALQVLQDASVYHGNDRELAAEYGRLALDLDQAAVAAKVLALADDPAKPDWKVVSARGAAAAKLGQYAEAVPFFERANELAPGNASVLNNLALAYASNGQAERGEQLLRDALRQRPNDERIRQNLTIVLGLRGRHDEAKLLAQQGPGADNAVANAELLRRMVRVEPAQSPSTVAPQTTATTAKAPSSAAQPKSAKAQSVEKPIVGAKKLGAVEPSSAGFGDAEADALIRQAIAQSANSAAAAPGKR